MNTDIPLLAACLTLGLVSPAMAEDRWTIGLGGGVTALDDAKDQQVATLSMTRDFGNSYVRASLNRVTGGEDGRLATIAPASTTQITLAVGHDFAALSADGYIMAGHRSFNTDPVHRARGTAIDLDTSGRTYGAGAALTYDAQLGARSFLSPFVSVDYSRVDTLRVVTLPSRGATARTQQEQGVTGSAGANVTRLIGAHSVGGYAAFVTTSNAAAANQASHGAGSRLLGLLDAAPGSDSWLEFGLNGTLAASPHVQVDLSVIRTADVKQGESTSAIAGLRFSF